MYIYNFKNNLLSRSTPDFNIRVLIIIIIIMIVITIRIFLLRWTVDKSRMTYKPAGLHVEVVPFFYGNYGALYSKLNTSKSVIVYMSAHLK